MNAIYHPVSRWLGGVLSLLFFALAQGSDENAYWGNYDFAKAIDTSMEESGLSYSGEFGFVDTYSYWPITHMVAPKEDALACDSCHARQGRMKDIDGVYVLGRDETPSIDRIMLLILAATLLGILGHGLVRVLFGKKGEH